jgi:hypothetical protein
MENHSGSNILIKKASGELEPFSSKKFVQSLRNAGADEVLINQVLHDVNGWIVDGVSTRQIYTRAFASLRKFRSKKVASQYKLKNGIMELGPTGYPFEQFIGKIFEKMGYQVLVGQIVPGRCVTHEVDVLATKGNEQCFVECKYGLSTDKNVSVKVSLYIRSRVNDLIDKRKTMEEFKDFTFQGWLVTNTRFTSDAIDYGTCSGLNLLSWDYPAGNSLRELIDRDRIYPITVLNHLNKSQKQNLIERGIVVCSQIVEKPEILKSLNLNLSTETKLMKEIKEVLAI